MYKKSNNCKNSFSKKIISVILILVTMIFTPALRNFKVSPTANAAEKTFDGSAYIYIDTSSNSWHGNTGCVAAAKFSNSDGATEFIDGTLHGTSKTIYKILVPAGTYSQMTLVRKNFLGEYNAITDIDLDETLTCYKVNANHDGGSWIEYNPDSDIEFDGRTFDGTEYIYIDTSLNTWHGGDECIAAAKFSGSDGTTEFIDGTFNGISKTVYKILVPAGTYSQMTLVRKNSSGTYNEIQIDLHNTLSCYKLNNNHSGGSWVEYNPGQDIDTRGKVFDAYASHDTLNNPDLYIIKATIFDYYTDNEFTNGWRNTLEKESHGDWEPYTKLNKLISSTATSYPNWEFPLYFGNFYDKNNGYTGAGESNLVRFNNNANNSGRLGGYNVSVTDLVGKRLTNTRNLTYHQDSSKALPYFDEEFLTENKAATIVNMEFPLRETTTQKGNTYYEFNSRVERNTNDNIWLTGYSNPEKDLEVHYGNEGKDRVYDALSYYSDPVEPNGVGFFPFDTSKDNGGTTFNNAYDYGFGMRVDLEFTLPKHGLMEDGEIAEFNFSGDDDLWVFVDDVLVLDLGGAHKMASGHINFNEAKSIVTTGTRKAGENTTDHNTQELIFPNLFGENHDESFNNTDPEKVHTLTMFYMERGMIESNLKFGFSFIPVGNTFEIEKEVNATDVNIGIQDTVKEADDFTFKLESAEIINDNFIPTANKDYHLHNRDDETHKELITSNAGELSLKNKEYAIFNNTYTEEHYIKTTESYTSNMFYSTSWIAKDFLNDVEIGRGTGAEALFQFLKTSDGLFDPTKIRVDYINTPEVAPLSVTKHVKNDAGEDITDDDSEFEFTLKLSIQDNGVYKPYPLIYKISGETEEHTLSTDGKFNLKHGQTAIFENIPKGISYEIVESQKIGYINSTGVVVDTIKDAETDNVVITNIKSKASAVLEVQKTLDGEVPSSEYIDVFTFLLFEEDGTTPITDESGNQITTTNNISGAATFPALSYSAPGTYKYVVKEKDESDEHTNISYDNSICNVTVTVETDSETNELTITSVEYLINGTSDNVFKNTILRGEVKIIKEEKHTEAKLSGAEFKIVSANEDWTEATNPEINIKAETNDEGTVSFKDLPFGNYLIYETKAPDGFELNGTVIAKVTIDRENLTHEYTVYNNLSPILPLTGGNGYYFILLLGIIFLLLGSYLYIIKNNRKLSELKK